MLNKVHKVFYTVKTIKEDDDDKEGESDHDEKLNLTSGTSATKEQDWEKPQYFHWFINKDTYGLTNNQWPGSLKIIVNNINENRN